MGEYDLIIERYDGISTLLGPVGFIAGAAPRGTARCSTRWARPNARDRLDQAVASKQTRKMKAAGQRQQLLCSRRGGGAPVELGEGATISPALRRHHPGQAPRRRARDRHLTQLQAPLMRCRKASCGDYDLQADLRNQRSHEILDIPQRELATLFDDLICFNASAATTAGRSRRAGARHREWPASSCRNR